MSKPESDESNHCLWLEVGGRRFELNEGPTLIGRAAGCQIVLDDALASRRHAQILVADKSARVEDLGSSNGVLVNGERIEESVELTPGDVVKIGQQEMVLRWGPRARKRSPSSRFAARTLTGVEAAELLGTTPGGELGSESTQEARALMLLGGVADKVLALGRGDEAERVLSVFLERLLEQLRAGRRSEPETIEKAVQYAVKIASATGKGRWVDYCFELYSMLGRPLPTGVVDELYTVLRKVADVDRKALRAYVALLREKQERFGPAERFLTQRIEGLERLASLK